MEAIFSLLNPYGPALPLITLSRVLGIAASGAAGGLLGAIGVAGLPPVFRAVTLGAAGALLTLFFDLVTNIASGLIFGQMRLTLLAGIPFALWHIGWNVALFVAIGTPLVGALQHYRSRL